MNSLLKKPFVVFVLLPILCIGGIFMNLSRPIILTGEQGIEISSGTTTRSIASELYKNHLIRSRLVFLALVFAKGSVGTLQYGRYTVSGRLSPSALVEILATGRGVIRDITVTIPEGLRSDQIADLLVKKGVLDSQKEFLSLIRAPLPEWNQRFLFLAARPVDQGLEGFLFGDTYRFLPHSTPHDVISTILETFGLRIVHANYPTAQVDVLFYPTLILSSILEQEVRTSEDRMMVADIFKKRIARGIPLQADSTVNYITGRADERARINDTLIASPYNTYRVVGLPPSPISNPSANAFIAALHPRANPYYFFLTDSHGVVHYGKTFDDHQNNRSKFLAPSSIRP